MILVHSQRASWDDIGCPGMILVHSQRMILGVLG